MYKSRYHPLLIVFWSILIADCILIYFSATDSSFISYRYFTKGLLVPVLIVTALTNLSKRISSERALIVTALLLAWAGDILLLLPGETYFIPGLVSFLLMHVLYCIVFWKIERPSVISVSRLLPVIIGMIAFDAIVMMPLMPKLAALKIPVVAYMVVISLMALLAVNTCRSIKTRNIAFQYFIPGAILFICSDAMLAYGKFYFKNDSLGVPVMLTYGIAQLLLVYGFSHFFKQDNNGNIRDRIEDRAPAFRQRRSSRYSQ